MTKLKFTRRLTDINPLWVHGCFLYRPTTPQCNCFYSWSTAVVFTDCIKYRSDYYNLFALQVSFHTLCHYVILKSSSGQDFLIILFTSFT